MTPHRTDQWEGTVVTRRVNAPMTSLMVSALIVAACSTGGGGPSASAVTLPASQSPTTVPVASPTASTPPTAEPSPSGATVLGEGGSGSFGAGTYSPAFQPPLTFTLAELTIMGTDGTVAYESIGEDDANLPAWVAVAFGFDKPNPHGHGTWSADFTINRLDKVFDPKHLGTLIDPPKDLAAWISKLPGLSLTAPPKAIKVGGLDATQLDVLTGAKKIDFGPIEGVTEFPMGLSAHHPARMVVVNVGGHAVVIGIGAQDDDPGHYDRVMAALQPLVDSIVWR